jgi:hypothetical protein
LTDADGKELTKTAIKKLQKELEKHKKQLSEEGKAAPEVTHL